MQHSNFKNFMSGTHVGNLSNEEFVKLVRSMDFTEIAESHRNDLPIPVGLTFEETIRRINIISMCDGNKPTKEQYNIMLTRDIPIIVDSGPGTGKTSLSQKILLIDELVYGIPPLRILAVTFSSKGAIDMKKRHSQLAKRMQVDSKVNISTMHSLYNSYIEVYYKRLGMFLYNRDCVLDEKSREPINMVRTIYLDVMNKKGIDIQTIEDIYSYICLVQDSCFVNEKEIISHPSFQKLEIPYPKFIQISESYKLMKQIQNKIDFTDMQVLFYRLLKENEDIRLHVQQSYDRIIVDEYQDTSKLQNLILTMILGDKPNRAFIIGDKDQGIYSWRGANAKAYDYFMSTYPTTKFLTMGINMRCPKPIIEYANRLIKHTKNRVDKMIDGIDKPCDLKVNALDSTKQCSEVIVNDILNNVDIKDYPTLNEIGVLYRTHSQAMFLIDKLLEYDIPVKVTAGKLPYNDRIVKDFMNIYYMLDNPRNKDLACENLFKICSSLNKKVHMPQLKQQMDGIKCFYECNFSKVINSKLEEDMNRLKKLIELVKANKPVSELSKAVLPFYHEFYNEYVSKNLMIDEQHTDAIYEYLYSQSKTFFEFGQHMLKVQQKLRDFKGLGVGVSASTYHGFKGLEADTIYILDSNGKLNPNINVVNSLSKEYLEDYIHEERNLFYVAITRTKRKLFVTYRKDNPSPFNVESSLILGNDKDYLSRDYINIFNAIGEPIFEEQHSKAVEAKHTMMNSATKTTHNTAVEETEFDKLKLNESYSSILDNLFG